MIARMRTHCMSDQLREHRADDIKSIARFDVGALYRRSRRTRHACGVALRRSREEPLHVRPRHSATRQQLKCESFARALAPEY